MHENDETRDTDPGFKPSQVVMWVPLPFVDTFKKAEAEVAAAYMVAALVLSGDEWRGVLPVECGQALKAHGDDPAYSWMTNPFCPPDFWKLVELGFAEFVGEGAKGRPVRFTSGGLDALRRWVSTDA
jgi:hypothetical protein